MERSTFDALCEYSLSLPTGTYAGKMWKAQFPAGWFLRWYSDCDVPGQIQVNSRPILVIGEPPSLLSDTEIEAMRCSLHEWSRV
jgi:hypothetical protein